MVYSNGIYFAKTASNGLFRNFEFCFNDFIEEMCVVALVLVVITISGFTFHLLLVIFSISNWYFSNFVVIVYGESLLLQYVDLINCILRLLSRPIGGFD